MHPFESSVVIFQHKFVHPLTTTAMPKKNMVFIARSLDGFIAGKNGELDWLESVPNPDHIDMGFNALMQEIDAIVMGRTTFEVVCGFGGEWPYPKPVYVLSRSLRQIPENLQDKARLLQGTPQEVLEKIHQNGHFCLYIDGGRTIQEFLRADLIDDMTITTIPVLLGGGFPLFGELPQRLAFDHLSSQVFLNQIVQDRYRRRR
jgi:dihydrofolate reductase